MVPDYFLKLDEMFVQGPVIVMLGTAEGAYTASDTLHPENRWATSVAIRALIENALVAEWRIYADNEPIRKLMAKG